MSGPVRNRTIVAALALPVLLVVALRSGWTREHASLPGSAAQLRLAVIDAGEVLTCFQGVQDELYVPGVGRVSTQAAVAAARARLATCDVAPLRAQLERIDLPPEPALDSGGERHSRALIADAVGWLQRVVTESIGTKRAMDANIGNDRQGQLMVLGFVAAQLGYQHANAILTQVQAAFPQPG